MPTSTNADLDSEVECQSAIVLIAANQQVILASCLRNYACKSTACLMIDMPRILQTIFTSKRSPESRESRS